MSYVPQLSKATHYVPRSNPGAGNAEQRHVRNALVHHRLTRHGLPTAAKAAKGSVLHETVPLTLSQRRQMEQSLMMFYLGGTRSASELLKNQSQSTISDPQVVANLKAMVEQARALRGDLCHDVDLLGPYLHEGWMRKRSLSSGISNPVVENAYELA